jgi:hypothetical protein
VEGVKAHRSIAGSCQGCDGLIVTAQFVRPGRVLCEDCAFMRVRTCKCNAGSSSDSAVPGTGAAGFMES